MRPCARFQALYADPGVRHVILFRNHGEAAGISLRHPHSQIIALPMVPMQIEDRLRAYREHYEARGHCLMCETIAAEIEQESRIVQQSRHFVSMIPYAALSPFHLWVFPLRHSSGFGDITGEERRDLAGHLHGLLKRLNRGLDDPSYNLVLRSDAAGDLAHMHWYISIVPRLAMPAGFELGSGMYINSAMPEESAAFLRDFG